MALSETTIRGAKSAEKALKLFDGRGLFLLVTPTGGKWWRFKYRFARKEKLISLGTYPETSLKDARDQRDDARQLLRNGVDPGAARKAQRASSVEGAVNCFEAVAREWFEK